ncbi:hypothetical protein [Streptomyces tsukubensis]|uniref:Uncharacterized protein n=1 Tax=Streptomyces tsukubensis TaxID=83656 RepID=A0A1V4AC96_9ACTN|nr:hypothetical protein [Streptomyces tsukubensis]OON81017.1 hypothetical protein B1H18_09325 [Streptomyces tsukubensis]QFR94854.1 hypothetical protein GBW32_19695 [Streptomyces tsukubensis]
MKAPVPNPAMACPIVITSLDVLRGDVILIGGQPCRVTDLFQLPGGGKHLRFESGETLTMQARTALVALRVQRKG